MGPWMAFFYSVFAICSVLFLLSRLYRHGRHVMEDI